MKAQEGDLAGGGQKDQLVAGSGDPWHQRPAEVLARAHEQCGFDGLLDRRCCRPSEKRVVMAVVERVLGLYRDQYIDCNLRHVHEKLVEEDCYQRVFSAAWSAVPWYA